MGRFKTFRTLVVFQAVEGVTALGDRVRVERCMRPLGSTRGIVWVRVLVNGQGTHTEQFSRGRLRGADRAFAAQVARISAAPAPAAAPTRAAGGGTPPVSHGLGHATNHIATPAPHTHSPDPPPYTHTYT